MSKKLLSFFIILFLSISIPVTHASELCYNSGASNINNPPHGPTVPGIISEDLHLTVENSPYYIYKTQVADGVTVTVDPGVEIKGGLIELFGNAKLIAKGTELNKINFQSITLTAEKNSLASVEIEHANLDRVSYNSFSSGFLILKHSKIINFGVIKLDQPTQESHIENNLFIDSATLSITPSVNSSTYIKNNTFKRSDLLFNYTNGSNQNYIIEGNNFLGTNLHNFRLNTSESIDSLKTINAQNNYWGTSNLETINSKIIDRSDDLNVKAVVDYQNFLMEYNKNSVPYPLDKPTLNNYSVGDSTTVINGNAEANVTVTAKNNNIEIGSSTTDEQGKFSIPIEKQKAGTVIDLTAENSDGATSPVLSVTVIDNTPPEAPIVEPITDQSRSITGKAEPLLHVFIKFGTGINPISTIADSYGNFNVPINPQKANTTIEVYSFEQTCYISLMGKSTIIKVQDVTTPAAPKLYTIPEKPYLIRVVTEPYAKVKAILPNKKIIYGTADKFGIFIANIGIQKPYSTVTFYSIDEASHISKASAVKVLDKVAPSAPKVNIVTVKSKSITGTTEPYAKVKVMVGKKQIALVKAYSNGRFSASINKQKYKTTIIVYSIDKAENISKGTSIKVRK